MAAKKCTKCGVEKPATAEYFHKHDEGKNGLRPDCIECHKARSRAYAIANRDAVLAQKRAYRRKNPAATKARDKAYYEANKAEILVKQKAYAKRNWDATLARIRGWRRSNPHKVQVWVRNRRARIKSLEGTHTHEDVQFLLLKQRGKCAYCGASVRKHRHVDHIIPVKMGGRNDRPNLQLLCRPCNLKKNAKDPILFMQERGRLL